MDNFDIIDVHIHLARSMSEEEMRMVIPGRRRLDRWATPETAISFMDWEGISKAVVMHLPPLTLEELKIESGVKRARRFNSKVGKIIREFNQWGCEVGQLFPRLIPFICIAPDLGDAEKIIEEFTLRVYQGAKGVKLHPGLFQFYPTYQKLWPLFKKCQD